MAQQLLAHTVHQEDRSLVPRNHISWLTTAFNFSSRECKPLIPLSAPVLKITHN